MAGISKGLGFFLIVDGVNMTLGLGKIEQMSIKHDSTWRSFAGGKTAQTSKLYGWKLSFHLAI